MTEAVGRVVLCSGMPESASTLQYQIAICACERSGTVRARGWYEGGSVLELLKCVPEEEVWIFQVPSFQAEYHFKEAVSTGHVFGLSTWRDTREAMASYAELHGKTMWWIARNQVLETAILDHRHWSRTRRVLMQSYEELTTDTRRAVTAISGHLDLRLSEQDLDHVVCHLSAQACGELEAVVQTEDLLISTQVAARARAAEPDIGAAWVESISGQWLKAQGLELYSSPMKRLVARLLYAPRLLWFLRWHLMRGDLIQLAATRARRLRSTYRGLKVRRSLVGPLARRSVARILARTVARSVSSNEITVILVSWNSEALICDTLRLIRSYSPPKTKILVVDNGSGDSTRHIVRLQPDVELLALRRNIGHGLAMDLGFLHARTEYCVALDVDAFPIDDTWLDDLRARIEAGAMVAGAAIPRPAGFYIHPCCLMMRRNRFVARRHSFESRFVPGINPANDIRGKYWDTGERISMVEGVKHLSPVPLTEKGPMGTQLVFGNLVYHNGATARAATAADWAEAGGVDAAYAAWNRAVARFDPERPYHSPEA